MRIKDGSEQIILFKCNTTSALNSEHRTNTCTWYNSTLHPAYNSSPHLQVLLSVTYNCTEHMTTENNTGVLYWFL